MVDCGSGFACGIRSDGTTGDSDKKPTKTTTPSVCSLPVLSLLCGRTPPRPKGPKGTPELLCAFLSCDRPRLPVLPKLPPFLCMINQSCPGQEESDEAKRLLDALIPSHLSTQYQPPAPYCDQLCKLLAARRYVRSHLGFSAGGCFIGCIGVSYQDGIVSAYGGAFGLNFRDFKITKIKGGANFGVQWTSVPPSEQGRVSFQACKGISVTVCGMGSPGTGGYDGDTSWYGFGAGRGMGWYAGEVTSLGSVEIPRFMRGILWF
jgi:hypothetical protein